MATKDTNQLTIIGRLTADAALSFTNSGYALTKFSIANNDLKKVNEAWESEVSFFRCILWGSRGQSLNKYLTKGQQVCIMGRIKQERWKDKNDCTNREGLSIIVNNIQLIGSNSSSPNAVKEMFEEESSQNFNEDLAF